VEGSASTLLKEGREVGLEVNINNPPKIVFVYQHNNSQHNNTQHNNTQHNSTQHNNTQHKR
jgi:hypothetical protein